MERNATAAEAGKSMDSLMAKGRTFSPPADGQAEAHVGSMAQYEQMYRRSVEDPDGFWLEQAASLHWFTKPTKARQWAWDTESRKRRLIDDALGISQPDGLSHVANAPPFAPEHATGPQPVPAQLEHTSPGGGASAGESQAAGTPVTVFWTAGAAIGILAAALVALAWRAKTWRKRA